MPVALALPTTNGGALYDLGGFDPGASDTVEPPAPLIAPTPPPPPALPSGTQAAVDVMPMLYRAPSTNEVVPLQGALPDAGGSFASASIGGPAAPNPLAAPTIGGAPFWALVAIAVLLLFLVR